MKNKIDVNNTPVRMASYYDKDYICISDIAKIRQKQRPAEVVRNWLRNNQTLLFLSYWENLYNEKVKVAQMGHFLDQALSNSFIASPKDWIESTDAIGIVTKMGRGGGTFAHYDIAIHFSNWLDPQFYLYFVQEFRRLKEDESNLELKQWDLRRELTKASYEIQTDAIREHLSPTLDWNTKREIPLFASEADLLNQAVFGMTAKEFKLFKPDFKGNLRDFATTEQLEVLNGLQHLNAGLIEQGLTQGERFQILYRRARKSLDVLSNNKTFQKLIGKGQENS